MLTVEKQATDYFYPSEHTSRLSFKAFINRGRETVSGFTYFSQVVSDAVAQHLR